MSSADARVVLVEYSVGEHETYVFVVTPEGTAPQVAKIAVGKAALARLARRLTALGADEAFRDPVLASLVMPAVGATQPGDVIYFVPHGALHRIPLQAVHVDGAPVIERNPVTVAPSASALRYCRAKRKGQRRSALIVADPGGASAPLVFAREQALSIAGQFAPCRLLSGSAATREALTMALREPRDRPDVLHFTAHGMFNPREPLRSGIELADGQLTAADFLGLPLDVDLVTLGACESGVGADTAGDDIIGLSWALFHAGTPTALLSLWRVDELSTSMLLSRFYGELRAGRSKAHALQAAQLWLRGRTAEEASAHAASVRTRLGGDRAVECIVMEHEAWLRLAWNDFSGALALYRGLRADPALSPADRERIEVLELRATLLARKGPAGGQQRYPFADPHYWAPFFLTGDWL
ncbi:CHAT domain-containing protein [Streptomyces avermitilis]|uniref:CHAT domain-containing protein n=1 Tax=Streptomyces avermitilis TaxID=33903 RepID=UPI0010F96FDC|nr:CHAT domain-containing protein [Streptomyces avermitilis]